MRCCIRAGLAAGMFCAIVAAWGATASAAPATLTDDYRRLRWSFDGLESNSSSMVSRGGQNVVTDGTDSSIASNGTAENVGFATYGVSWGSSDYVHPLSSTFDPSSPGIGGAFRTLAVDAFVQLQLSKSGYYASGLIDYGSGVTFDVAAPTPWSVDGWTEAQVYAPGARTLLSASLAPVLVGNVDGPDIFNYSHETTSAGFTEAVSGSGVLLPGTYRLHWNVTAEYPDNAGSAPFSVNSLARMNVTFAVPEPSSLALLAIGAVACIRRRRRA